MRGRQRTRQWSGWAAPAAALVGWAAACAAAGGFTNRTVAAILGCAGTAAWAGLFAWQRDQRRRRDCDAYEHLQLLRDRTVQPGVRLLAVVGTDWVNDAGQAAVTVEVSTGRTGAEWFPLAAFPHGSLVLVSAEVGAPRLLDWMPPQEVQAAHRNRRRQGRGSSVAHRRGIRRRRRALIAEIETALRQPGAGTTPDTPTAANPTDRKRHKWKETP